MFVNLSGKQLFYLTLILCPILLVIWSLYILVQCLRIKLHDYQFIRNKNKEIDRCIKENQGCSIDIVKLTFNLSMIEKKLHEFQKKYATVIVSRNVDSLDDSNVIVLCSIIHPMIADLEILKKNAINGNIFIELKNQGEVSTYGNAVDEKCVEKCNSLLEKMCRDTRRLSYLTDNGVCLFQIRIDAYNLSSDITTLLQDCKTNIEHITGKVESLNISSNVVVEQYDVTTRRV